MYKVRFKVEERFYRNNAGKLGLRYITRLLQSDTISEEEIITKLSSATNISESKIQYIFLALKDELLKAIIDGRPVDVPFLGRFKLSMKSKSTTNQQDAGLKMIEKLGVNFFPNKNLTSKIDKQNILFKRVYSKEEK